MPIHAERAGVPPCPNPNSTHRYIEKVLQLTRVTIEESGINTQLLKIY